MLTFLGVVSLSMIGAPDGSQFEGGYKCASMFGGNILNLTLARDGGRQIIRAKRFHGPTKREYQLVNNGVVTNVATVQAEDTKEDWVYSFQDGSLKISVMKDGTLNMIVVAGKEVFGFWPCFKTNIQAGAKK